jgi:hypothetical protein
MSVPDLGDWRVAQILIIEMNLGAPRAGFARGVFDFAFGGWHTFKPREGVPHPLWFSKGAFFALVA